MNNNLSFSNTLIIWAGIVTFLALFMIPQLFDFGMNRFFFLRWDFHVWIIQFFSSQLLHWSILHFAFNTIFILYFWNIIEQTLGYKKMFVFFVLNSIFLWLLLTFLTAVNTVWASGFAMAILAYYTIELYKIRHPDYGWWVTALMINIWIWLLPGISLLWHLWGALFWVIFWYGNNIYKKYI